MAFADPQTISSLGGITSLVRTGFGPASGSFGSADGTIGMQVSHLYKNRTRRVISLTQSKISADPLVPSQNSRNSATVSLVVNAPVNGFTVAEMKAIVDCLVAFATASTGAKVTQLLGGEN